MLRINLLPEHYVRARKAKLWIVIMAVLLVVIAAVWVGVYVVLSAKQNTLQAHLDLLKPEADSVRKLEGDAKKIRDRIPAYGDKVNFVRGLAEPPEDYIAVLEQIEDYIFEGAQVTSWTIDGSHASIDAEVGSTTDAGRYYLNIRRCPAFKTDTVQISAFGASGARGGAMMAGMGMMGPEMGMMGGGMSGMGAGAARPGATAEGRITVHIEADLAERIEIKTPGGAAPMGRAGGGGGMMGGEMGMMGGEMGSMMPEVSAPAMAGEEMPAG